MTIAGWIKGGDDVTDQAGTNSRPPFRMDRFLAPLVFAGHAYRQEMDNHFDFTNGLMTLNNQDFRLTIEEESGKLVALDLTFAGGTTAVHAASESPAFDKTLAQIIRFSDADRNQADAKDPIDSILAFLLQEALRVEPLRPALSTNPPVEARGRAAAALEKILNHRPFAPLDAMVARRLSPHGSASFHVPIKPGASAQGTIMSFLAPVVFCYGNDLLPEGSWPWLVLRETVLCLGNQGKHTDAVLQFIYGSDQTGPVGFETIARLLDLAHSPATVVFAKEGLTRLTAGDFRNDCRVLLDGDSVLRQCIVNVAQGLAALDDGEVEALAGLLSPDNAALLRLSVQSLRQPASQTLTETLSPALNQLWDKRLKELIRTDLLKMATPPATNAAPAPAPGSLRIFIQNEKGEHFYGDSV